MTETKVDVDQARRFARHADMLELPAGVANAVRKLADEIDRLREENEGLLESLNGAHPSWMKRLWSCEPRTCIVRLPDPNGGFAHYETPHGEESQLIGGLPLEEKS